MENIHDISSLIGELTGTVLIEREIDRTKFSTLYEAFLITDQEKTKITLTTLNAEESSSSEMARFLEACESLKANASEGIVNLIDVVSFDEKPALLYEWFEGKPIKDQIKNRLFSIEQFLAVAIRLSQILGDLHNKNIIHREVTPRNIWVGADEIRLTGFGFAASFTKENESFFDPYVIKHLLCYMSPEQTGRMNRPVDYRTDFYSLGLVFYEMLTGKYPFVQDDPMQVIHSHLAIQPKNPRSHRPEIPGIISALVMKLLSKNAENRYQSGFGLLTDLKICQDQLIQNGQIEPFTLASKDIPITYSIPQILVGRDEELSILLGAFENIGGDRKKIIMVAGEPGVGKTAVINELQKPIVARRGYFLSGKYNQFKQDTPYSAIVEAFKKLIEQILAESHEKQDTWKNKLMDALGDNGKIITDVIPDAELLIGKQPDVPVLGPKETKNRFDNVFSNFMSVFTQKAHPLVLFLDDLQWADTASLSLIEQMIIDVNIQYLFLIGAYRHTEVDSSHPMMTMVSTIKQEGHSVKDIFLKPFGEKEVKQFLTNFLKSSDEKTNELAALLYHKTGGNPFFVNQFMKTLYDEKHLRLDLEKGWEWDDDELARLQMTDNVVTLMAKKIKSFKQNEQNILKICACIGIWFDLETISFIYKKSLSETLKDINAVIKDGFIYLDNDNYRFQHDRIQEAAYDLLTEDERVDIHHRLGEYLVEVTPQDKMTDKILYIVGHLNLGFTQHDSIKEKERLIRYNLMAADKSVNSTAYQANLRYLETAISLFEENCWEEQYELSITVYTNATYAAFLTGDYDAMESYQQKAIIHAKNIIEKSKLERIRMLAMIARGENKNAMEIGLAVLQSLGVKLPRNAGKLDLILGLIKVGRALKGKEMDTLYNLPAMTDSNMLMAMDIITYVGMPVYMVAPNLYPILSFQRVLLSLQYGNNPDSQIGYVSYGLIMGGVLGKAEVGDHFGKLALRLSETHKISKARVYGIYYGSVSPWKNPLSESVAHFMKGYHAGLESGEYEFGSYCLGLLDMAGIFIGTPLTEMAEKTQEHMQSLARLKQAIPIHMNILARQQILFLNGQDKFKGENDGSVFQNDIHLKAIIEADERASLFLYYIFLTSLLYQFGDHEKAVDSSMKAEKYADSGKGFFMNMTYHFNDALICAAHIGQEKKYNRKILLKRIKTNLKKLKLWAKNSPVNCLNKYHLALAEFERVNGKTEKAIENYEKSIKAAKVSEFIHEEGLANELFFKFWAGKNQKEVATVFLKEAIRCYNAWDAHAILDHLEKDYPEFKELFAKTKAGEKDKSGQRSKRRESGAQNLDMSSIIKTSQAISQEINLARLLETLIKISFENAGAEKGCLVMENEEDQKLYIQAKGEVGREIQVLQSESLENTKSLCPSIVNFVHKTRKNLVIHDAQQDENFQNDSYIVENQCKSILCAPIRRREKVAGIIYMENNLSTNSFTPERLKILEIFSSQAAISMENAILLAQRENSIRLETEMKVAAELQLSMVPQKPVLPGFDISGYMKPADEVGGDYYDVIETPSEEAPDWIIMGDVSGHGIQAGLIMLMVQTAMQLLITNDENISPAFLISETDKVITANINKMKDSKYMTISALAVKKDKNVILHSGLHQDICVYRKNTGRVEQIESKGIWLGLGMGEIVPNENLEISMEPGDKLLLFTDGLTESVLPNGEFFGQEKLVEIFEKNGDKPPTKIKHALLEALTGYTTVDDITFLILNKL